MSRTDAIIAIVMTTIAMIAGMLPMALGVEGDSSFRAPMAAAVIGGLLTSTALSLLVVPVVFELIDEAGVRLRALCQRRWRRGHVGRTRPVTS